MHAISGALIGALRRGSVPVVALGLAFGGQAALAHGSKKPDPLVIAEQGGFAFGGKTISDSSGGTLHCDHGYAQYNIPVNNRDLPLVMWHSASSAAFESTPDGREGWQQIFLRRSFPVYVIDLPRQGKAGNGCVKQTYTPEIGRDQATIINWRFGTWDPPGPPKFFPGVQVPTRDANWLDQLLRGRYPGNDTADGEEIEPTTVVALLDKIGPSILLTHSGSAPRGWTTRLRSSKVKGIVSIEPGDFVFPPGELPPPITSQQGATFYPGKEVSLSEFKKLTQIPIQIIVGDYVPESPSSHAGMERRRIFVSFAKEFVASIRRHGGDIEYVRLPDRGIRGNTHLMMAELNNVKIADVISDFLKRKRLDKKAGSGKHDDDDHGDGHDGDHGHGGHH